MQKYMEAIRRKLIIKLGSSETKMLRSRYKNMKLEPNWISGFVDGEGTFYVGINNQPSMTIRYQVLPEFRIVQHKKDIKLLYAIKDYFKCGVVRVNHSDRYEVRIRSIEHLNKIIIPFFEKYELQTQKKFDFIKFKKILL